MGWENSLDYMFSSLFTQLKVVKGYIFMTALQKDKLNPAVNEQSKAFFQKKLCCGCCQLIGDGHNSKTCTKRRKCRDCDEKHPTIMHGLQLKKKLKKQIGEGNQEERSR